MSRPLLILGGTRDARLLADALVARGMPVVTSLAGGTTRPILPAGDVRVGGFGGVDGLTSYLIERRIAAVVDATHPFAAQMTSHAAQACSRAGVPRLVLTRPSWTAHRDTAIWHWVDDQDAAADLAARLGERIFLAVGRHSAAAYADRLADRVVLLRVAERRALVVPARWDIIEERGPFDLAHEAALLADHGIDVLVTKDSGGPETVAKLDAAGQLGVAVVVVRRPLLPPGTLAVETVEAATAWCCRTCAVADGGG